MAYSVEHISEQIFKIVKGFDHAIVLFTDDGKKTSNPEEARRFFAKDIQMMINFIADETTSELVINLSKDTDIKTVKPLLSSLRNLANRYIIEYTVKTFGKTIAPKDFAYQARAVKESEMSKNPPSKKVDETQLNELTPKQKAMKQGAITDYPRGRGWSSEPNSKNIKRWAKQDKDSIEKYGYEDHYNDMFPGVARAKKLLTDPTAPRGTAAAFDKGVAAANTAAQRRQDKMDPMYRKAIDNQDVWDLEARVGDRAFKKATGRNWDSTVGGPNTGEHPMWTRRRNRLRGPVGKLPEDINEGFSGWHGSARKSVNELGDARLIVMHKRNVDETSRGARTRQIESIFIENNQGERFKFPSKSLTAAKAMVRHVKEGGTPFDEFGQYIYECMEELGQLKTFQRKNRRNDFFEDANISEEINNRISSLRSTLGQISGPKGYAHHFESFKKEGADIAPEKLDELKDNVTVRYFDEAISGSLPYVARIIENMHSRQEKEQQIVALAKHVMDNKDNIVLNRPIDNDDPENPGARKFRDPATAIAAWVSYLAPLLKDDELANKLMQVSDTVFDVGAKHANMAAAAINVIRSRARVAETTNLGEKKKSLADSEMHKITEAFDKYNVRKIFGV